MKNRKKQVPGSRDAIPKVRGSDASTTYTYKFGHRAVRLTVEKNEVAAQYPLYPVLYYSCPSCKKEFDEDLKDCPACGHALTGMRLRRCPQCAAKNDPGRRACLMCGASLPVPVPAVKKYETVLRLDAGGMVYKSNDGALPARIKKLFADLASSGYSKAVLEPWVNSSHDHDPYIRESMKDEYDHLERENRHERYIFLCLVILTIIGTYLLLRVYLLY